MMNHPKHKGVLQFESFQRFPNLVHFTTTREGGGSTGAFASFNLGYFSGDDVDCVSKNRNDLCRMLSLTQDSLYVPYQTHGAEVALVEHDFLEASPVRQKELLNGKDALLTSQKGVCIAVSTADCVPILLYAEGNGIAGVVHAGWRGTCGRILQSTVQVMIERYGCSPYGIHAAIGPSIGKEAFEVGNEVYDAFYTNGFDMDAIATLHPNTGKYHIDLWEANYRQLLHHGIPARQIEVAGICTYMHSDAFFSARRLGIASGRMLTGICMR